MQNKEILKNYQQDLQKSRTTPLLIELSKKDLDSLCNKDNKCGVTISLAVAKAIYDKPLKKDTKETNLIYIDGDSATNVDHIYLLEKFFDLASDHLKYIKNLAIVKESISAGLSFATGGLLNGAVGGIINSGVEMIADTVSGDVTDFLIDTTLDYIDVGEKITDIVESKLFDFTNDNSIKFLDSIKENHLYLSPASKEVIAELSKHFKEDLTPAESFRFILELMLSVTIDMPTLLYVKNPHKLDRDSLAILSLLFSFSKDAKDTDKHTGLSVIYAYEDKEFQPYKDVKEEYKLSKQLLDEQRLYTQRYAMLERPTSDIPHIAVKSSMFVGRKEELKNLNARYHYSKEHTNIATLETISGEPGIGKTKLVKKHLTQIRGEEHNNLKQIQLTLLNQVGHTSSNTGLGSLTDSIVKEASRLETVKTFSEKLTDKGKNYIFGAAVDMIKSTLGVDAVINIGGAINDSVFLKAQMEKTELNTVGNLDNPTQDQKQIQFTNLTIAIKKLKELSDDTMPIVLFVDDLQWIDEDSSEYLIEHFIKQFNVHIVATIRPSDATTVLGKAVENMEQNKYKVALLKKVDIKIDEKTKSDINTDKLEFNATHLLGLDSLTLKALISQVIQGDETHQTTLAKTIIKELNNDKNKDEVNTLFAVETINMLCDAKLYTTQDKGSKIEQLILTDIPLRFNTELNNFQESLEHTFKILHDKYKTAFEHINAEQKETEFKQKFNLMAYAVLEERLKILKIYFSEHGEAAVNTLLFSSFLGTLFNSKIIKEILESLSKSNELLLKPLKNYILEEGKKISLTETHYEIIDEVYEILSRYTVFYNTYEHRHSLLSIFLDKQLEHHINTIFKNDIASINKLYSFLANIIIVYNDDQIRLEHKILFFHNIVSKVLDNKLRFDNMDIIYDWYMKKYTILYEDKKFKLLDYNLPTIIELTHNEYKFEKTDEWKEKYFNILWKGVSLNDRQFNSQAISYIDRMYPIVNNIPNSNKGYKQKGEFYYKTGGYKYLHISYKEGLKELLLSVRYLKLIQIANNLNKEDYADAQATLSYSYSRIGELLQRDTLRLTKNKKNKRLKKALKYHNLSLLIINELTLEYQNSVIFEYKKGVVYERIGQTYKNLNDYSKAIYNFKEALKIKENNFKKTNESFGYRKILIVIHDFYKQYNMLEEANKYIKMAILLTNNAEMQKYINNKDQYQLESYIKIYSKYTDIYTEPKYQKKLIQLNEIIKERGLSAEY